ncbi:amidohydrolase family protein [Novosphingobium sp. BL-8A]|uniref:amidohydrolase family protein n=1 Tax=Novosphingobium sp. BL-8A TaxID=3127639 RepID=UPI00375745A7
MLIRNADVYEHGAADLRIVAGTIAAIGQLAPLPDESVIEANGGALLPGLHDHHIHLAALAVRAASVDCGPPAVSNREGLARTLDRAGKGWLRGFGLCESVLGGELPDAAMLDRMVQHRPIRLQHRTGRMWLFNSPALDELLAGRAPPPGLERVGGRFTGRLFDEDAWLQAALGSTPPDFAEVSSELARHGVTGITDMSPRNDAIIARHFASQAATGHLRQNAVLAGQISLADAPQDGWRLGPAKLHLHEAALPDFDTTCLWIASAHAQGRGVAVHCVTEVELVFTLALFEAAGTLIGDRIEHASIVPRELAARMASLGLWACVQPHFVHESGDRYLRDVEPRHHSDLYRLFTLRNAGIPLAGGSDAPYGNPDPWAAMKAAVLRRTGTGTPFSPEEALSPEQALDLYLADPLDLSRQRRIAVGEAADLCLLDRPWAEARTRLDSADVRATFVSGQLVHHRVDEAPIERLPRAKASA